MCYCLKKDLSAIVYTYFMDTTTIYAQSLAIKFLPYRLIYIFIRFSLLEGNYPLFENCTNWLQLDIAQNSCLDTKAPAPPLSSRVIGPKDSHLKTLLPVSFLTTFGARKRPPNQLPRHLCHRRGQVGPPKQN